MDRLERELRVSLARAAETGAPDPVRLRNPALAGGSKESAGVPGGSSGRRWAAVAAAGMTMAVAAAVVVPIWHSKQAGSGTPRLPAASSSGPATSSAPTPADAPVPHADGKHPLWPLKVPGIPSRTIDQLPVGPAPDVPLPYTLDPRTSPELAAKPTLVTAEGRVEFTGTVGVDLLDARPQGLFVETHGPGHDGEDGLYDVRVVLVGKGNTQRELYHGAVAGSFAVSPDGATVAVDTWIGVATKTPAEVVLVDVASGRITHRLAGRFNYATWLGNTTLLLKDPQSGAPARAWRAPWTASTPETVDPGSTGVIWTAAGLLRVDETQGCLQRLDSSLKVLEASCGGWSIQGRISPDGRYVPVEWRHNGDQGTRRAGLLDMTTNQITAWPADLAGPSWLAPGEALLSPRWYEDQSDSAHCLLATGTCERIPADSFSALFRAATWLGRY
ncbi:MAG TPA: hypothetical protein VFP72_06675 [Kineosporiaceae bacterium]|nr:hypothetical protein [Kineosporiaceae bacterium]